jgi:glycerophosphoryl diester phosphodiesterase
MTNQKKKLCAYTAIAAALAMLAGLGVDGIISDYPERFAEALTTERKRPNC